MLEFGKSKVKNLYATIKGGKGPTFCFAGHTDVVPPGDLKNGKQIHLKQLFKMANFTVEGRVI